MTVVVATRFKVSRARHLLPFLRASLVAALQARRSPGIRVVRLRLEPGGSFWTMTEWESGADVAAYRDSGAHAAMMPDLARWAAEASFIRWKHAGPSSPTWADVRANRTRVTHAGRLDQPSPAHLAGDSEPPTKFGLTLGFPVRAGRAARKSR